MGDRWTLQDANNRFSAVVAAAQEGMPQHVTKRGAEAVVALSAEEYERLVAFEKRHAPKRTLIDHLLNAPKLPEDYDDLFDDRDKYSAELRDIDVDE